MSAKILIVDDEELIRWSLAQGLGGAGYRTVAAESADEALEMVRKESPDLILTDLRLGGKTGLDLLKEVRGAGLGTPVILMTAFADLSSAVEALREGAADYIAKPIQIAGLKITLARVLETAALRSRLGETQKKRRQRYSFDGVVGESSSMKECVEMARKVAENSHVTVLILGESGCGKDHLARTIHYESARASEPFMEISCTAIPEHLLESELFGNEKGAFTGAMQQKKGLFETAAGGTVFLNEIGHMPMSLQAKMLRVLEDKTFKRVGGREDITVDVRILAATNEDLEKAIAERKFREDLYYRINVLTIRLRPLRERREDILPLVEVMLERLNRNLRKPKLELPKETLDALAAYDWPGNIRELRNVLERMLILGETSFQPSGRIAHHGPAPAGGAGQVDALPDAIVSLDEMEKTMVRRALDRSGGNQQKAARRLGISRDALRRRIEKFGIKSVFGAVFVFQAFAGCLC